MKNIKMWMLAMVFVLATLIAGFAKAENDRNYPLALILNVDSVKMPGIQLLGFDGGINVRLNRTWSLAATIGTEARVGQVDRPMYHFDRLILSADLLWQFHMVLGWRFVARTIPFTPSWESQQFGFFTGPNLTFARYDDVTFDVGVLGGKFLSEPDGYGAAMAVFRLWFKIL